MSDPWQHFDEAFKEMERGFRSIDWRELEDMRHTQTQDNADPQGRRIHKLHARSWRSRWLMARLFAWLAWRILTRGKVTIKL